MVAVVPPMETRQDMDLCSYPQHGGSVSTILGLLSSGLDNRDSPGKMKANLKQAPHSLDLSDADVFC